jgi:hypothetical protein
LHALFPEIPHALLYFQYLAASFPKSPGWGVPQLQIARRPFAPAASLTLTVPRSVGTRNPWRRKR